MAGNEGNQEMGQKKCKTQYQIKPSSSGEWKIEKQLTYKVKRNGRQTMLASLQTTVDERPIGRFWTNMEGRHAQGLGTTSLYPANIRHGEVRDSEGMI